MGIIFLDGFDRLLYKEYGESLSTLLHLQNRELHRSDRGEFILDPIGCGLIFKLGEEIGPLPEGMLV